MWGIYISTTLESLAVHCNDDDDDDPSLLLLPLEKFCLEYGEKFKLICSIGGVQGRIKFLERKVWDLGFELLPTKLFLASQVRDKVRTSVLLLITDQRLGKSVNLSLLKNLMLMLNGSVSRELRFLEKPFLDSTAEFYAAEAKQPNKTKTLAAACPTQTLQLYQIPPDLEPHRDLLIFRSSYHGEPSSNESRSHPPHTTSSFSLLPTESINRS
ncbi:unnamed protein product [Brassica oleracea]